MPFDLITLMEFVKPVVASLANNVAPLCGAAASTAVLPLPRVGPGRALGLAVRSYFAKLREISIRQAEIRSLQDRLGTLSDSDDYLVVYGPNGVGKTCLLRTALRHTLGVVYVVVSPGNTAGIIADNAFRTLTKIDYAHFNPQGSVRRVLFWYRSIFRLRPPIVVLCVAEARNGNYAEMTAATRRLAAMGLRVIVDASENSLDTGVLSTKRERAHPVDLLTRDQVAAIPKFQALFTEVEDPALARLLWTVVGGNPAVLESLADELRRHTSAKQGWWGARVEKAEAQRRKAETLETRRKVTREFVLELLRKAISLRTNAVLMNKASILELFAGMDAAVVSKETLEEIGAVISEIQTCKLFRTTPSKKIVPSSPAVAFALQHRLHDPDLEAPTALTELAARCSQQAQAPGIAP
eukprot:NODE_1894_length_1343_cov_14.059211_g1799_i0.p1 GENE.NODE_1894_length_1343_cov_14.059211_g1799_i0~~NODE_1894_length_1343_cov_14.059211_g1799_i0.p1  ORF type:complete len:428 (-),score=89.54 NODE_1894_length_1343_cov_14.059211_g1799_i0:59-1291(-)